MARYIDADLLIKNIANIEDLRTLSTKTIGEAISNTPTADVGEWQAIEGQYTTVAGITMKGVTEYRCSVCGHREIFKYPYCNCGAKMDGGKE